MDSWNNQVSDRTEGQYRDDLLNRFEIYNIMIVAFFRRLSKEEKIDAMIEIAETLREEQNGRIY